MTFLGNQMKQVVVTFLSLALAVFAGTAGANCYTDTNQADFQAGVASSVDLTSSPGNVLLSPITGGAAADQQQQTWGGYGGEVFSSSQWNAQTFTAGMSGPLTRVDVNLYCYFCGGAPPAITVSIRATSGGVPTGGDLATSSTTITNWSTGQKMFFTANFSAPTTVSAGTQYAIVIRASAAFTAGQLAFSMSALSPSVGNDLYPRGQLLYSTTSGSAWTVAYATAGTADGLFITYVGTGASGYNSSGNLVSSVKDGGTSPTWSTVSWNGSTPTNTTLKFQAAASSSSGGPFTFVGPDGTSATYFTSGASLDRFSGSRYLKYRAFLSTTSSSSTPTLNDATVCYTAPASADLSISNTDGVTSVTAGGYDDLYADGREHRPEQRDRCNRGRHVPVVADLQLDLFGVIRQFVSVFGLGQHQQCRQPAERRQRNLHSRLLGICRGIRHADQRRDDQCAVRGLRSGDGQQLGE